MKRVGRQKTRYCLLSKSRSLLREYFWYRIIPAAAKAHCGSEGQNNSFNYYTGWLELNFFKNDFAVLSTVLLENGWNSKQMIMEGGAAIPLETTLHAFRNQEKTKQRSTID